MRRELYDQVVSESEMTCILKSIQRHVEFLSEDKNYSQHTNHGFDQMLAVYKVCLLWSDVGILAEARDLSLSRLLDELSFVFTEQGVHKENSPGYQKFMLSRLNLLIQLEKLGDDKLWYRAKNLADDVESFLQKITLPNGLLPAIGDTKGNDTGKKYNSNSTLEIFDYAESGYVIARGKTLDNKPFHLVFKCGSF